MTDWREVKLGDVCEKVYSGGTPKSSNMAYYGGSIPWLNTKEVHFNRIYKTEKYITESGFNNSSAKWVPANSVIVAMYGVTAGNVAINLIPLTTNQACCNLLINKGIGNYKFIFYYLLYKNIELSSLANGGAQQNLNAQQIKDFPITLPPLEIQRKIAGVLGALDDKIELNNKINQNLELQAQALFKSWFVDFKPFGGTMPEDWYQRKLEECTDEIIRGFTSKYVEKSNLINLNQKVNKGDHLEKQYYKFLDENILVPKEKYAKKKDILLNSLGQGTLGRIHFWYETATNIVIDQHITIIRAKRGITVAEYLYLLLNSPKYKDYFEGCVTGTTGMLMLNISAVRNADIMLPPIGIQEKFASVTSPLYEKIEQNNQENEKLSTLRDTLLPKLMSGKINVDNVDISEQKERK